VLDIDIPNRRVTAEPGVTNLEIHEAGGTLRVLLRFPDPSESAGVLVGGNIAENSGGAHCLKYGFTGITILAVER